MTDNNRITNYAGPVLSDYFARLTLEYNILRAECELVVMGIFVYASSKEIEVWNATYTNCEKSRGNLIDVILTDGFHFRKVLLCPRTSLEDKVLTNKLHVGKKIKLMQCSLNVDATNPDYRFIAVHELEIVGDAVIPDIDTLSPDPRCTALNQMARNFMPMLENRITYFDIWFNNIPRWPPEEMFALTPSDDEQLLKVAMSGPFLKNLFREHMSAPRAFPVRPIIVRVICKGNLYPVNSERGVNCPYHSLYRIADASGACTMIIFNEANIMYNRIQEGTLLYLAEYYVKVKDLSSLIEAELSLHSKCKGIANYPMEIQVLPTILKNQNNISAIPMKIIDGAHEDVISKYLPLPVYNFLTKEMLDTGSTGLVDVVGVVVGISRYIRLKQKNHELHVSRWLEIVRMDESQKIFAIYFAIHQQVEEHVNLKLGELVVITNMKCKQWGGPYSYLECTRASQIIGYCKRNHAMLCKHEEYINAFNAASNQEYVDSLLEKFGWLGGSYNLIEPPNYDSGKPFMVITPCNRWNSEIYSLACSEMKPMLIQGRIARVLLCTAAGTYSRSRQIYWHQTIIYKMASLNEAPKPCYGSEFPHVKTFPAFYDVHSYLWRLETMQFPPLDVDEWFAKQHRMNHPYFKEGHEPLLIPVPYLCVHVLSSSGDKMFICCFPLCFPVECKDDTLNLKQLLSLKLGTQCCGSKLAIAEKNRPRSKVITDNLCVKLQSDAEEILKDEVICLVEVCRIESDVQPEIILRKVYWEK